MISEAYNMDCMDFLKDCKDKQFDLAIVDPPYGIGAGNDFYGSRNGQRSTMKAALRNYAIKNWDKAIPNENYFNEVFRISKNQIIWGANHFVEYLTPSMGWVFWDKMNAEGFSYSDGELAYTSFKRALKIFRWVWEGMRQGDMKNKEIRIHPTQKPVKLYKWLLKNYAKEGDKIIDTHLGSGSSRIACYDYGFDFWGMELDKDYFEAQEKRFKNHISQINAFHEAI